MNKNLERETVKGFGEEWSHYDQSLLRADEREAILQAYFRVFPEHVLSRDAIGFDLGCGSGRWAACIAPKVGQLHCIDASDQALSVAEKNLHGQENVRFHHASVDAIPLPDDSMDFGYSLGVLHHVPDTAHGVRSCVEKLKPGAPLLLYLYYACENRPFWFRAIWRTSDVARRVICRLPFVLKNILCTLLATVVYLPLARSAFVLEKLRVSRALVSVIPLSSYRDKSFYTMRTDSVDRFGTRLEQRFTKQQIQRMMEEGGLERIEFSPAEPFWCAVGYRKGQS